MYLSLVSPLDQNPDPKDKPYLHMKNHHGRLCGIDLEAAQNSPGHFQTANGSVLCHDTVPSEFFTKIINIKDGSERFVESTNKRRRSITNEEKQTSIVTRRGKLHVTSHHCKRDRWENNLKHFIDFLKGNRNQ